MKKGIDLLQNLVEYYHAQTKYVTLFIPYLLFYNQRVCDFLQLFSRWLENHRALRQLRGGPQREAAEDQAKTGRGTQKTDRPSDSH